MRDTRFIAEHRGGPLKKEQPPSAKPLGKWLLRACPGAAWI